MSEGFHLACKEFPGPEPLGSAAPGPGLLGSPRSPARWEGKPVLMVIYHLSFSLK